MIKCYVSCYDNVFNNVKKIESQLKEGGVEFLIINSSDKKYEDSQWINLEKDQWYFFQIYEALKDFNRLGYEYMVYMCGDIQLDNFATYIKKIEVLLKRFNNVGILSPTTHTRATVAKKKRRN